jgi:mannose-6-phosphate isomerase
MGGLAGHFSRFPLLLKFLDVSERLSVQVHPSDAHLELIPPGETGKTEAWVVLEADAESRIYAGLTAGTTADNLRAAIANGKVEDHLACFTPKPGDAVLVRAGTVHSLNDVVVFEVQENSDVTFRLYDWDHVDPRQASIGRCKSIKRWLALIFRRLQSVPLYRGWQETTPALRERLFHCDHFGVWRISGDKPFSVGKEDMPRVLVCIAGETVIWSTLAPTIPSAKATSCFCLPSWELSLPAAWGVTLLQISLPKGFGIR